MDVGFILCKKMLLINVFLFYTDSPFFQQVPGQSEHWFRKQRYGESTVFFEFSLKATVHEGNDKTFTAEVLYVWKVNCIHCCLKVNFLWEETNHFNII